MKKIEFSFQEADIAVQLLDLAVKANGLNIAKPALDITIKFQEAFKEEIEAKREETKKEKKVEDIA